MKCFYHSEDLDGHCSGAIVKYVYPECEMHPINYGDEFPWDLIKPDEVVFMVDFSLYPFSDMVRLNKLCRLTWIDHHKTAIVEDLKTSQAFPGLRHVGQAGCELVWEYLLPHQPEPRAVHLLGRYDVWDHSEDDVLPFQMGMRMQHTWPDEIGMHLWTDLFRATPRVFSDLIINGRAICAYQDQWNQKYAKSCAFETELDGLHLIAANITLVNSKLFDAVWDESRHDAMLTFGWRKEKWTVSLYTSKPNIDVSKIAKARGGGGHEGAAGFQCEELPFELK